MLAQSQRGGESCFAKACRATISTPSTIKMTGHHVRTTIHVGVSIKLVANKSKPKPMNTMAIENVPIFCLWNTILLALPLSGKFVRKLLVAILCNRDRAFLRLGPGLHTIDVLSYGNFLFLHAVVIS